MRFPGFIGPSYTLQSVNVDCQRCVNLFPEMNDLGTGKGGEIASLVSTPGLRLLLTLPQGPVRGLWRASNGELFAVGGNKLYKISSAWVATELGSLNTSEGAISISDNGEQVVLVDGLSGYVWTLDTSSFVVITDPDFAGADRVAFLDGYFIFTKDGTQQFQFTGLNDVTFDALDIGTAEGSPDNLVGHIVANQQLYLLGEQSIEVFYNSGDVDSPFQRVQGAVIDTGCAAAFSIAKLPDGIYWLGGDSTGQGIVYRMQGYQPERISTSAIEAVIRSLDPETLSDARSWTYQQGGHIFYCLNLPGTKSTWVYDTGTKFWHERTYLSLWEMIRHRADCHAVSFGENVVGDYENGKIYALDLETYTDNGTSIVRVRAAPHLSKDLVRLFHSYVQLDMETGVGLDGTGQGVSPRVMLRWSDDSGHSWSNERSVEIGPIGARRTRVIFRRLGSARDRVYEVRITDPVKVVLISADLGVEGGTS